MVYFSFIIKSYFFSKRKNICLYTGACLQNASSSEEKNKRGGHFGLRLASLAVFFIDIVKLYIHVCVGFVFINDFFIHSSPLQKS